MGEDASEVLGSPQVGGVRVMPKGGIWKQAWGSNTAGAVGGVAAAIVSSTGTEIAKRKQKKQMEAADTPKIGDIAYLAATAEELALVSVRSGPFKLHVGDQVLLRMPRDKVQSVEYHGAYVSSLAVLFDDETRWEFDVPKSQGKNAKAFAAVFSG